MAASDSQTSSNGTHQQPKLEMQGRSLALTTVRSVKASRLVHQPRTPFSAGRKSRQVSQARWRSGERRGSTDWRSNQPPYAPKSAGWGRSGVGGSRRTGSRGERSSASCGSASTGCDRAAGRGGEADPIRGTAHPVSGRGPGAALAGGIERTVAGVRSIWFASATVGIEGTGGGRSESVPRRGTAGRGRAGRASAPVRSAERSASGDPASRCCASSTVSTGSITPRVKKSSERSGRAGRRTAGDRGSGSLESAPLLLRSGAGIGRDGRTGAVPPWRSDDPESSPRREATSGEPRGSEPRSRRNSRLGTGPGIGAGRTPRGRSGANRSSSEPPLPDRLESSS